MFALPRALFRLGRNLVKYRLLGDTSIRSDRLGREHMADLAVRFVKNNRIESVIVTDYAKFASVGQAFIVHTPFSAGA